MNNPTDCKDRFNGVHCSLKCGLCDDDEVCEKRTGYGCNLNLLPPFCKRTWCLPFASVSNLSSFVLLNYLII